MNCKNCGNPLQRHEQFCGVCGGRVVTLRMTFGILFQEFSENVFGFDSRFFKTLKNTAIRPHIVIKEYLDGVRKRYMNPFGFLAISAALSLLVFNYFADDFTKLQTSQVNTEQIRELERQANLDLETIKDLPEEKQKALKIQKNLAQLNLSFMDNMLKFSLQYLNLFMFIYLFFFAVLSKWTFWKPYNYGEHLIINAYLYGIITYATVIFFLIGIFSYVSIFYSSYLLYPIFYLYTFQKLNNLTFWQLFLRILKFLLGLLIISIILIIIGIVFFFIYAAKQGIF